MLLVEVPLVESCLLIHRHHNGLASQKPAQFSARAFMASISFFG